jgi:AraC-like DNA-binding protein
MVIRKYAHTLLSEKYKPLRHGLIWIAYVLIQFPIFQFTPQARGWQLVWQYDIPKMVLNLGFIYANLLWLVPRYLYKKRLLAYLVRTVVLINIHYVCDEWLYLNIQEAAWWINQKKDANIWALILLTLPIYNFFYLLGLFAYLFIHYLRMAWVGESPFHGWPFSLASVPAASAEASPKYRYSDLTEEQAEAHYQKIIQALEEEKLYRRANLTLNELASHLNMRANHLSQIINDRFCKNFNELLSCYRVEEVKAKLLDSENDKYTLLGLATEAGFNSKSSFHALFKQHTGMTPSQFKRGTELE